MCLTPLLASKYKLREKDMTPLTNNWRYKRTERRFYAEIVTDITTWN
jgi:hypothetical protein